MDQAVPKRETHSQPNVPASGEHSPPNIAALPDQAHLISGTNWICSHIRDMVRYGTYLAGKALEADDLVQATVERLLDDPFLETYRTEGHWRASVFRAMWYTRNDRLRCKKAHPAELFSQIGGENEGSFEGNVEDRNRTGDPEKRLLVKELLEQSKQILSPIEYRVFLLKFEEERSIKEIAKELDLPEGTVKSHLSRARRKLISFLAGKVAQP